MNIKKEYTKMFPVFRKVLDAVDFAKIGKKTNYSSHTVRQVLMGYVQITERNQVIIDEAVKVANKHLQKSLKTLGHDELK